MLVSLMNEKRLISFDNDYNRANIKQFSKENKLTCPICGKTVEYCHGQVKIPYFRHKDKEECFDKYSENETKEHLIGKMDIYNILNNIKDISDLELEGWIAETKQKPDIMFKYKNQQYVIEFQCTPISTEYRERHNLYRENGIKDIWICGTRKYFQQFHKGSGDKMMNDLELQSKLYYDFETKCFYKLESMDNKLFNKLNKKQLSQNIFDDSEFVLIKSQSQSYVNKPYYPSGRPSNKYKYPLVKSIYCTNLSIARRLYYDDFEMEDFNID